MNPSPPVIKIIVVSVFVRSADTDVGRGTVRRATEASERAEATLLAALTPQEGERLREALKAIVAYPVSSAE